MDLTNRTESELLRLHAEIITELRTRGVVRTSNNPIGDYTEWLVCERLHLQLQPNSNISYDGVGLDGVKYQIKGRRSPRSSGNVQLSVIRNLEHNNFDFLIAVVYNPDYSIRFAAKIPHGIVREIATYRSHVNGHGLTIRETVLDRPGVEDITSLLQADRIDREIE